MNGGPSHVDTWDHKPELAKRDGQSIWPASTRTPASSPSQIGPLMKSPFDFAPRGKCGKMVSVAVPEASGKHVDDMAFLHSLLDRQPTTTRPALFMMNTGMTRMGFPCAGCLGRPYGLGSDEPRPAGLLS